MVCASIIINSLNASSQLEYDDFGIELIQPELHWDSAIIAELKIAEIKTIDNPSVSYQFNKYGKLLKCNSIVEGHYQDQQVFIEFYENGRIKNIRKYYSTCDYYRVNTGEHTIPICFDLTSDLSQLDTVKAEKILPDKRFASQKEPFWKQTIKVQGFSISVQFQISNSGELFYLKWNLGEPYVGSPNRSLLNLKINFDSTGVISEFVEFNDVGPEWGENADTTFYMSFTNVNRLPRCTKKIIWDGGGYDALFRIYECFDTDEKAGIDTGYFLLNKDQYSSKTNYNHYDYDIPFAESFRYTSSGKTEVRVYHCLYDSYSFDENKNIIGYEFLDSIYMLELKRFFPNNFYESIVTEHFTHTYNWIEACNNCRGLMASDFYQCYLEHNKGEIYLHENWIYDSNTKCDSTYVLKESPLLSKREHKKLYLEKLENTKILLSDTSIYKVQYFPN